MAHINVPPTRSNLLRMKQELQFAREGYEILDRKREVLTSELIRLVHDAGALQEKVWKLLSAAYLALEQSKLTMGQDRVEWAALAMNQTVDVHLKFRGVMGVPIPQVESRGGPQEMTYSMGDTTATLDEASAAFREVLNHIPELSELMTAVWRLAGELRKTQRRVKALQYIFIPEYEETVLFIKGALEEREREETFRLKWLKTKMTKKAAAKPALEAQNANQEHSIVSPM
ncbi:MAG: V-type ATP synthase subunit D [Chloroflexi bacterium]|nr:V-type ATP synthase subunit D [Chloroflexota bacterium]MBI2759066.1 V-type ATP synthase subunit D [Chloroflexota bacterium]